MTPAPASLIPSRTIGGSLVTNFAAMTGVILPRNVVVRMMKMPATCRSVEYDDRRPRAHTDHLCHYHKNSVLATRMSIASHFCVRIQLPTALQGIQSLVVFCAVAAPATMASKIAGELRTRTRSETRAVRADAVFFDEGKCNGSGGEASDKPSESLILVSIKNQSDNGTTFNIRITTVNRGACHAPIATADLCFPREI
jgi:hypothetical protein